MATVFTGGTTLVQPEKASYSVGETVRLHIKGEANVAGYVPLTWHTKYEIRDLTGKLLTGVVTKYHLGTANFAKDDFTVAIGPQMAYALRGTVRMTAGG